MLTSEFVKEAIIPMIVTLLGGLALFLYGMQMMSNGLENAAGNKMKKILERFTSNRLLGVIVGAVITAVIQSSSATTVMAVGFVNTGMMTLSQAVWIIMGANIGTTVTGQLVSMDVDMIAPVVAFLGVAAIVFFKSPKVNHIGQILAGFGVLFIGMNLMGDAMSPLKTAEEFEGFRNLMAQFENPILGILVGATFTAVIQSSSASIGILQALARSGLVTLPSAVYVLFGQNIGTCITAVLASIGTNRNAKRTTVIHLLFNVIGTTVFTLACYLLPRAGFSVTDLVASWTPNDVDAQIANMHTLFNITTTLLILPFGAYLARLATVILPERKETLYAEGESALSDLHARYSRQNFHLGFSAVHTEMLRKEIHRMLGLAKENLVRCFNAVIDVDLNAYSEAEAAEEQIDGLNKEISQYISKTLVYNNESSDIEDTEEYFTITGNTERIGDHAVNIGGYVEMMAKKNIIFSDEAKAELAYMRDLCDKAMTKLLNVEEDRSEWLSDIAAIEQQVDDLTVRYRENHIDRMKRGLCTAEGCILYSELLTDFERVGDHALNIAQAYSKIKGNI